MWGRTQAWKINLQHPACQDPIVSTVNENETAGNVAQILVHTARLCIDAVRAPKLVKSNHAARNLLVLCGWKAWATQAPLKQCPKAKEVKLSPSLSSCHQACRGHKPLYKQLRCPLSPLVPLAQVSQCHQWFRWLSNPAHRCPWKWPMERRSRRLSSIGLEMANGKAQQTPLPFRCPLSLHAQVSQRHQWFRWLSDPAHPCPRPWPMESPCPAESSTHSKTRLLAEHLNPAAIRL